MSARAFWPAAIAVVLAAAPAGAGAQGRAGTRFAAMDRNGDGVITRDEWRGNDRSFRSHDWNGDGVLSGKEVQAGARQPDRPNAPPRELFSDLDTNGDGVIARGEWHAGSRSFDAVDENHDGVITRNEIDRDTAARDLFDSLDADHNGTVERDEWRWSGATFDRRDADRDGRLSRDELGQAQAAPSPAFQSGYDRGLVEGRAAGREDRERNQGWDLEGQRELEQADSGYDARMGPRADYQSGYREGFRRGYREGFGPR